MLLGTIAPVLLVPVWLNAEPVSDRNPPPKRRQVENDPELERFGFEQQRRSLLQRERSEEVVEEDLGTNVVVERDGDIVAEGFSLAEDEVEGLDVAIEP